jgi:two-component system sensor histidine kinase DegS
MNDIYQFLIDELDIVKNEVKLLEQHEHEIQLRVQFISRTVERIAENNDSTGIVFMSSEEIPGFDGLEIKKLEEEKSELIAQQQLYNTQINEKNNRKCKLEQLISSFKDLKDDVHNKASYDIIYNQEADRQRIARDIHDTVVQTLTALIYKNEFIKKVLETDRQRAKLEIDNANKIIRESIEELRNIIFDLRPMALDDLGFEKSFYDVIEKMKNTTSSMIIQEEYNCKEKKIDFVVAITVIRIIEELVSNSIKHSEGTRIWINIRDDEDNLIIEYSDNGKGYDFNTKIEHRKDNTGFGLGMMRERVDLLHGSMKVKYEEGILSYYICVPFIA